MRGLAGRSIGRLEVLLIVLVLSSGFAFGQAGDSEDFQPLPKEITHAKVTDVDGSETSLDELNGRVLVVHFWAVCCGPCRTLIPKLVDLQSRYRLDQLQVIGFNVFGNDGLPETDRDIKVFASHLKINYYLVHSSPAIWKKVNDLTKFNAIPQTMVIGRRGDIRAVFLGAGPDVNDKVVQFAERVAAEF
jgi:thiol-disulfide isomerase/thioredoxin